MDGAETKLNAILLYGGIAIFYALIKGLILKKDLLNAGINNLIIKNVRRKNKMVQFEGRCMKCRKQVVAEVLEDGRTARGVRLRKGKCPFCQTTVCRMGG